MHYEAHVAILYQQPLVEAAVETAQRYMNFRLGAHTYFDGLLIEFSGASSMQGL